MNKFNKIALRLTVVLTVLLAVTGCGAVDRLFVAVSGNATETCYDGVMYLQFTSGASVAYNTDGTVKACDS